MNIKFNNTYSQLPGTFYQKINPSFVINPKLIKINNNLLKDLSINLDNLSDKEIAEYFSGNKSFENSNSIAQVYAGHQFSNFSRRLWDGRAVLLWEILDKNNKRKDIVLKWSWETIFSRGWDGKATLWSVIREYVISEAMYALWVSTTRSLSIVTTWEDIFRENIKPWAILTRIASSHIRFWSFEYFFHNNDYQSLELLADYTINRHFSDIEKSQNKYTDFYKQVIEKQIDLIVDWMRVWFIHGVMNTDNMLVSWETIDYGPCAFMDNYNKNTVFSSIDQNGRYSFMNQKYALNWNLARFWETLIPLMWDNIDDSVKKVEKILWNFEENFDNKFFKMMNNKIGIFEEKYFDNDLVKNLLEILEKNNIDYTDYFRNLSEYIENNNLENIWKKYNFWELIIFSEKLEIILSVQKIDFWKIWIKMKKINPNIIPRNYRVEEVIKNAEGNNNFSHLEKILEILKNPYSDNEENKNFMKAPESIDNNYRTFCGT